MEKIKKALWSVTNN